MFSIAKNPQKFMVSKDPGEIEVVLSIFHATVMSTTGHCPKVQWACGSKSVI
jgi:hypothetical protein